MPPPDSSLIENGVIAFLGSDATLLALVPDGVYYAEGPQGATRFVVVQLMDSVDEAAFSKGRAYEDALLMVKAVMSNKAGGNIQSAANRIDALLEDATGLTASGFTLMTSHREGRIRVTEIDDEDPSIRWQHRGGFYRVQFAVN